MNQLLRKAAHAVYDIRYLFIWTTKYRKAILIGINAIKIRDIIKGKKGKNSSGETDDKAE